MLEIEHPRYLNEDMLRTNQELSRNFILAMYDIWKKNQEIIEQLKDENYRLRQEDERRDMLAKTRLIEMLNAAKQ